MRIIQDEYILYFFNICNTFSILLEKYIDFIYLD